MHWTCTPVVEAQNTNYKTIKEILKIIPFLTLLWFVEKLMSFVLRNDQYIITWFAVILFNFYSLPYMPNL